MMKNIIGLFFTIAFLTQKLKLVDRRVQRFSPVALAALLSPMLLGLLPLSVLAGSVEIYRWETKEDRVTLRVKVVDDDRRPIEGLSLNNFKIEAQRLYGNNNRQDVNSENDDSQTFVLENQGISSSDETSNNSINQTSSSNGRGTAVERIIKFLTPRQSKPDPAYIAILLDMSGSMKHEDAEGIKKVDGAVGAIREFLGKVESDRLPFKVAIIPFGEGCSNSYRVNQNSFENNFYSASSNALYEELERLEKTEPCAATNLYQPVEEAAEFLGNNVNYLVNQESPSTDNIQPRLAVILLSDGYHANREMEQRQFDKLMKALKRHSQISVHTLGYGEPLFNLYDRAKCRQDFNQDELTVDNIAYYCELPQKDITEFIVDERRLKQIARATGGIHEFPNDALAVAENLKTFLTTLREYEITFVMPDADRASLHEIKVRVDSSARDLQLTSEPKVIRMSNFIYRKLPLRSRLGILGLTAIASVAGLVPFIGWSKSLKREAERNLL